MPCYTASMHLNISASATINKYTSSKLIGALNRTCFDVWLSQTIVIIELHSVEHLFFGSIFWCCDLEWLLNIYNTKVLLTRIGTHIITHSCRQTIIDKINKFKTKHSCSLLFNIYYKFNWNFDHFGIPLSFIKLLIHIVIFSDRILIH